MHPLALADELYRARCVGYVPAGVVAQTWRGSARQHATMRLLRAGAVHVDPLSEDVAYRLGLLLAKSGTSDVVDAHVALLARRLRASVVTSDPAGLAVLDPSLILSLCKQPVSGLCLVPPITVTLRLVSRGCLCHLGYGVRLPSFQDVQNAGDELSTDRCQQATVQQGQCRFASHRAPSHEFYIRFKRNFTGVTLDMPLSAPECSNREVRVDAVE
jgi:hypothetical protein